MNFINTKLISLGFGILTSAMMISASHAGSFNRARVAGDAQWLAHIDVERFTNSVLVKAALKDADELDLDVDGLDEVKEKTGIDPLKDIKDITIFGNGHPEHDADFVAIISANAEIDDFLEALKAQPGALREMQTGGYAIKAFGDGDEVMFFHVRHEPGPEDRVVLISRNAERLARGIAIVDGKHPNLAGSASPSIPSPADGSYLFVHSQNLKWIEGDKDDPGAELLRNAESVTLDAGETAQETFFELAMNARNSEDASNAADVVRGLLAIGRIAVKNEPELAPMRDLISAVKLDATSNRLKLSFRQKTSTLLGILEDLADDHDPHDNDDDQPGTSR